jgi:hypothetical protein
MNRNTVNLIAVIGAFILVPLVFLSLPPVLQIALVIGVAVNALFS